MQIKLPFSQKDPLHFALWWRIFPGFFRIVTTNISTKLTCITLIVFKDSVVHLWKSLNKGWTQSQIATEKSTLLFYCSHFIDQSRHIWMKKLWLWMINTRKVKGSPSDKNSTQCCSHSTSRWLPHFLNFDSYKSRAQLLKPVSTQWDVLFHNFSYGDYEIGKS